MLHLSSAQKTIDASILQQKCLKMSVGHCAKRC